MGRLDLVARRAAVGWLTLVGRVGRSEGCDATRDAQAGGDGREDGDGRLDDKLPGLFLVC